MFLRHYIFFKVIVYYFVCTSFKILLYIFESGNSNIGEELKMTAKNSSEKHDKIMKIKKDFKKVLDMDLYIVDKAPLFKARVAEFRRSIFELAKLIPPSNFPTTNEAQEIASGEILEENETDEEKIYREYAERQSITRSSWSIW